MKLSVAPACASKLYSTSLPAAPARPETGTMLVSGVATGPPFSVHGGWTAAATAAAASTMPAPIGWVEIGRASCRERVLHYVSIPVVAVTIKQKDLNQRLKL